MTDLVVVPHSSGREADLLQAFPARRRRAGSHGESGRHRVRWIALEYGVDNPPSKYVLNPQGRVVAKIVGPVTANGLDSAIETPRAEER